MKVKLLSTVFHGGAYHGPGFVLDLTEEEAVRLKAENKARDFKPQAAKGGKARGGDGENDPSGHEAKGT